MPVTGERPVGDLWGVGPTTAGRRVIRVAVKVRSSSFFTQTRQAKLRGGPTTELEVVTRTALSVLAKFELKRPVRLLGCAPTCNSTTMPETLALILVCAVVLVALHWIIRLAVRHAIEDADNAANHGAIERCHPAELRHNDARYGHSGAAAARP
jgi:hypothetical protein